MNRLFFLTNTLEDLSEEVSRLGRVWDAVWPKGLAFLESLLVALVIYVIGRKLIRWILKLVRKGFDKAGVEDGVAGFVSSVIRALLYLVLVLMLANIVGIQTTSVVALVGSAGLTVGLALQGSLSNFAGGVLILVLKPFHVGDYIVVQDCEGTVVNIDIFYTKLLTTDNRSIVLPNGTLSNGNIINVTKEPERRLDLVVPISYSDDIRTVKALLQKIAANHTDMILQERDIAVMVGEFGEDAVKIVFRVWVKRENYWPLRAELLEEIKYTFDENHITIPFRQMNVFLKQN